jgi:tetratricopeptide (TPR) repeat protein
VGSSPTEPTNNYRWNQHKKHNNINFFLQYRAAKAYNPISNNSFMRFFRKDEEAVSRGQAEKLMASMQYPQAEEQLRRLLQSNPSDRQLQYWLAQALVRQHKLPEGIVILEKIVKDNPNDAAAQSYLGSAYCIQKDYDNAKVHSEIALKLNENDFLAEQTLESIPKPMLYFNPQTQKATPVGDISTRSFDDFADSLMATLILADPERTDELLKMVAKEKGQDVANRVAKRVYASSNKANEYVGESHIHYEKAEALFGQFRLKEAIDEYKKALETDPKHAGALMGVGDCYFSMGDLDLAVHYFKKSIEVRPAPMTYRFLGDAYFKKADIITAIDAYQHAIALNPNYKPAQQMLDECLRIRQQTRLQPKR